MELEKLSSKRVWGREKRELTKEETNKSKDFSKISLVSEVGEK